MSNIEYVPPETLRINLSRPDGGVSWGFRLQGGADFSTPLSVQSVQPNSVAERSGLQAGDGLLAINNISSDTLSHENAKMEIIRSGNEIALIIQRGAVQIWKPKVTPMSELRPQELRQIQTATGDTVTATQKTSLAHEPQESLRIGSGHNRSAKPFVPGGGQQPQVRQPPRQQQPSAQQYQQQQHFQQQQQQQQYQQQQYQREPISPIQAVPNVVHAQFNTPIGLYSPDNIANTYHMQTEGIQQEMQNLDIDNKPPGTKMSGTYQVIDSQGDDQGDEQQNEAHIDAHVPNSELQDRLDQSPTDMHASPDDSNTNTPSLSGFRSVKAPITKPVSQQTPKQESMYCGGCGNMVSGVFVRIKGTPFHPQCFKCASCGLNLKQKGYFIVEDNLYCETHAKQKAEPPGPNMKPVPMYR